MDSPEAELPAEAARPTFADVTKRAILILQQEIAELNDVREPLNRKAHELKAIKADLEEALSEMPEGAETG